MKELFNIDNSFMKKLGTLVDYFLLNICFLMTCLPVVTIGCSILTLNRVIGLKEASNEISVFKLYFSQFKNFIKLGTGWFLSFAGLTILGYLSLNISFQITGITGILCRILDILALITLFGYFEFSSVYFSRYDDKFSVGVKNSLLIFFKSPVGIALVVCLFVLYQCVFVPKGLVALLYFLTFGGGTLIAYIKYRLFVVLIKKYE